MGNIETTTKFARLKSISSIEDTYLEAATGCSIKKAVLKNFAIFTRKQLCCSFFLIKLQAAYRKSETQDPNVGPGTLRWDPRVRPYGGTLRWD